MVALYRNDGERFTDVTAAIGLTRRGWGTGVCVADYDNDGYEDMYITAYGPMCCGATSVGDRSWPPRRRAIPDGAPAARSAITIAMATSICTSRTSSGSCPARCRSAASGHPAASKTSPWPAARVACRASPTRCIATTATARLLDVTKASQGRGARILRFRRAVQRSRRRRLAGHLRRQRLDAESVLPQPARRDVRRAGAAVRHGGQRRWARTGRDGRRRR